MRKAAVTLVVAAALLVGATGCVESSHLVADSRVIVAIEHPVTSLEDVASLTGTGFGYRDDSGGFVRDRSFGHAEIVERDPLTVRYTVADGVRWSDGTPVDAADLVVSWAAGSGVFEGFEQVPDVGLALVTQPPQVTPDRRTVFLHFDRFFSGWESVLAPTLPAHVVASLALDLPVASEAQRLAAKDALIEAVTAADADALEAIAEVWNEGLSLADSSPHPELLISAGPYVVDEVAADRVVLTANPEYRGDREPRVETIELRTIADPAALGTSVTSGAADVAVGAAGPELLEALNGATGAEISVGPGGELEQLQLMLADSRNKVFDDPRIREAFLRTVPRAQIAAASAAGADTPVLESFLVPPSSADYSDTVAQNGSEDYGEPDLAAPARLLTEAGVAGTEVCVLYDPADPTRAHAFELIRDAAAPAGFLVTDCSTPDWMRMLGRGGAYDAALLSWDPTPLGPSAAAALLRSDSTVANLNRFADPAADALIDELEASDDPARQDELVAELDAVVWSSAAGLPLFAHPVVTVVGPGVTGVTRSSFGGSVLWNAWTWQASRSSPR